MRPFILPHIMLIRYQFKFQIKPDLAYLKALYNPPISPINYESLLSL